MRWLAADFQNIGAFVETRLLSDIHRLLQRVLQHGLFVALMLLKGSRVTLSPIKVCFREAYLMHRDETDIYLLIWFWKRKRTRQLT